LKRFQHAAQLHNWPANSLPANEKTNPVEVSLLGAQAIVQVPSSLANLIHQADRARRSSTGVYRLFIAVCVYRINFKDPVRKSSLGGFYDQLISQSPEYSARFAAYITLGIRISAHRRQVAVIKSETFEIMNNSFNSLPWHDATLLSISVDRRKAGERDEVHLLVAWPNGEEAALVFSDCYAMNARMNFGIIAAERIDSAKVNSGDPDLSAIRDQWKAIGVSLESLSCYCFDMSSTASTIRIYAIHFEIL
jgi:hypothetical protein